MTGPLAGMHLADHCAGSPTSPTQPLWLPDLPDICLLAYGCSSAAVVVQSAQVGWPGLQVLYHKAPYAQACYCVSGILC